MLFENKIWVGTGTAPVCLLPQMANRHGLIAGATGTGKTVSLKVLAEGLISLGLIEKEEEVGKYYMHGVSHHLGIDVHDVTVPELAKLAPGMVITNEPGIYIPGQFGVRIEDLVVVKKNGCDILSHSDKELIII